MTKEKNPKFDPYSILISPLQTEKSVRLITSENKMVFNVYFKANKAQIKSAFEQMFNVKVAKVTTMITPKGTKRAYIRLAPENPAIDIATKLGMM
ncbi:50S ribosomal protein L23 [Candidatus Woesearchaeota archaeon]|nr:50S ribosomal protein L23 [Candidatus Woesearchaeota archaeon]